MIVTADLANAVSKVNPIFLEGTLKLRQLRQNPLD